MDDFTTDLPVFLAVISGGEVADEVSVVAGKSVVIGENMLDRVISAAEKLGAEYYKPAEAPASEWMANNKSEKLLSGKFPIPSVQNTPKTRRWVRDCIS